MYEEPSILEKQVLRNKYFIYKVLMHSRDAERRILKDSYKRRFVRNVLSGYMSYPRITSPILSYSSTNPEAIFCQQ